MLINYPTQSMYQTLTTKQQLQYDVLIAVGATPAVALSAVGQIPASVSVLTQMYTKEIRLLTNTLLELDHGASVTTLQNFLMSQKRGVAAQNLAAIGASGYFGALTRSALAEFQTSVGITPALGNFGPVTREYISAHYY
jgi:peptidoglycan hydrolase-like protein with peptidoglycan-binding domain